MSGVVLAENARMLALARAVGFEARTEPGDERLVRVSLAL